MLRQLEHSAESTIKFLSLPQLPPPQDDEQLEQLHLETMAAIHGGRASQGRELMRQVLKQHKQVTQSRGVRYT